MTDNELPSLDLPEGLIELACAKNDVRYYLDWPFLDLSGDKPMLVATNGHVLAAAPVELSGEISEGPIPLEAITAARKKAKKEKLGEHGTLYFNGNMVGPREVMFERPDYNFKFPKWRRVAKKCSNRHTPDIGVNYEYLTLAGRAVSGPNNKYLGTKIYLGEDKEGYIDPTEPLQFQPPVETGAFAIVMPMRL